MINLNTKVGEWILTMRISWKWWNRT